LTQKQLASLAGLRQASISAIESGTPNTKLQTLLIALAALGLEFQITPRSTDDWSVEG
jgi:HTH-type transcriptional regulator/antitoxin HipB